MGNGPGGAEQRLKLPRIRRREMQVFSVEQTKVFLKVALPTMYGT